MLFQYDHNNNDNFIQSPHSVLICLQHVRSSGQGAIVCKSCAQDPALIMCKCHVTCHLVQRDSSATKFQSLNHIYFSFILLAEPLNRRRRGGNRSTQRKCLATSFRKRHTLNLKVQAQSETQTRAVCIGGRLGKQMCYPLYHALPAFLLSSYSIMNVKCGNV